MTDYSEIGSLAVFILSILWMHLYIIARKESRSNLSRICFLDGFALVIVIIGCFYPKTYVALMEEDYIGEWITFYAFVLSGLIVAAHLWYSRRNGSKLFSPSFLIPIAVCAFCLFVAGEETSWGQRIFAFKPPDIFLEQNYQQELNIHNLFKGDGLWGIKIESKYLVMLIAFIYGILFPTCTRFLPPLKKLNAFAPDLYLMPYFILIIAMEEIYPISLTAEACEMYLGIIFLVHVYDTYPISRSETCKPNRWHRLSTAMVFVFALGTITAPVLDFLVYGSDEDAQATVKEELQLLQADFLDPETDKEKIMGRKRVHKRIYTAVLQKYFHLPEDSLFLEGKQTPAYHEDGDVRNDRRGYFLDPWNNPYWIYYHKKKKRVIFYSFGANRKRDSNLRRDLSLKGDDLGVTFSPI